MNIGADFFYTCLLWCYVSGDSSAALWCLPCPVPSPHLPLIWPFLHTLRFCQGPEDQTGARDLSSLLAPCAHDGGESLPEAWPPLWAQLMSFENKDFLHGTWCIHGLVQLLNVCGANSCVCAKKDWELLGAHTDSQTAL